MLSFHSAPGGQNTHLTNLADPKLLVLDLDPDPPCQVIADSDPDPVFQDVLDLDPIYL